MQRRSGSDIWLSLHPQIRIEKCAISIADSVQFQSAADTVGVLTPTWTRDLMDEDPEYGPNEPPSNCPNMALSWSYSGALRFCPGGGVNSTRIGVPAPWRMIVRGFYDGYSNGDEPEFITNSNGTSPCPVITTEFWGPGQLT